MYKKEDNINLRELENILLFLYGFRTGQNIFNQILKERCCNERQDIFAK